MEIIVRDLLALMFPDEPVEVVSIHNRFRISGCFRCHDADRVLDPAVIGAPVRHVWHSVLGWLVIAID